MPASPAPVLLLASLAATSVAQLPEPSVTIGVLSLFHPQVLILTSDRPATLQLDATTSILPAHDPLTLRLGATGLTAQFAGSQPRSIAHLELPATTFTITVPGKLSRTYTAGLTVSSASGSLQPVITLPTESVVASIVAAEAPPHASLEALKAQAVVTRSFLLATPHRHRAFTACDTTHCQYLRATPPPGSPAARATAATRGLVLTWSSGPALPARPIAAMYSRSCGGTTHAPPSTNLADYPYFAVPCQYCRRHPQLWTRPAPASPPASEKQRLDFNRIHGWSALPSTAYSVSGGNLEGRGTGHGVGLCQLGAEDLARRGATFTAILGHYYPAATLTRLP